MFIWSGSYDCEIKLQTATKVETKNTTFWNHNRFFLRGGSHVLTSRIVFSTNGHSQSASQWSAIRPYAQWEQLLMDNLGSLRFFKYAKAQVAVSLQVSFAFRDGSLVPSNYALDLLQCLATALLYLPCLWTSFRASWFDLLILFSLANV